MAVESGAGGEVGVGPDDLLALVGKVDGQAVELLQAEVGRSLEVGVAPTRSKKLQVETLGGYPWGPRPPEQVFCAFRPGHSPGRSPL